MLLPSASVFVIRVLLTSCDKASDHIACALGRAEYASLGLRPGPCCELKSVR